VIDSNSIPPWFLAALQPYCPKSQGIYAAQLLWQRGINTIEKLHAFLKPEFYQPSSSRVFGQELDFALARMQRAIEQQEQVTIWGDFDADGITSTAVLWSGLGEFLPQGNLDYYIPDRLTESHGLNCAGIDRLAQAGTTLIITCDTGSTNIAEIIHAQSLGIDIIITDHHTTPTSRPPAIAILNPRYLPIDHPLAHLSGVAVAYKFIEALYALLPNIPQQPVTDLLDLVAIGLIADLVQLTGDCRYLAQIGIEQLRQTKRLGVQELLKYCKRSGDRPTDISFGIAPRLNAISRIHGDAGTLVELLTSHDQKRVENLAAQVELANTRRKALEKDLIQQVKKKIAQLDMSTTSVIVLADPQWQVGILGLVAGRIAQEYQRPTILLNAELDLELNSQLNPELASKLALELEPNKLLTDATSSASNLQNPVAIARGSARSFGGIDLYELVSSQSHLLHNFGGHPFAAGLSLPVANIPIFTAAINQKLRQKFNPELALNSQDQPDLVVTVGELGQELWEELKLLEPCGMGNPQPKILLRNCQFKSVSNSNITDAKNKKVSYIKTSFEVYDQSDSIGFPGLWWGHYKDELPPETSWDAIVKLDYNNYEKRPQLELLTLLPPSSLEISPSSPTTPQSTNNSLPPLTSLYLPVPPSILPPSLPPLEILQQLLGIAKYLSRTETVVSIEQLQQKLGLGDQCLSLGLIAIQDWGFRVEYLEEYSEELTQTNNIQILQTGDQLRSPKYISAQVNQFLAAITEEQFRYQYFQQVSAPKLESLAS
jgi:single-stranded-DNA-specific exonuclease